jgi:hypothetical protein
MDDPELKKELYDIANPPGRDVTKERAKSKQDTRIRIAFVCSIVGFMVMRWLIAGG